MSFVDIEFFFFLPLAFALYWLTPRRASLQNACLLLLSWLFYAGWDWRWLPLLWVGAAIDYAAASWIERRRDEAGLTARRIALSASLVWNLGALGYFKYANFFLESASAALERLGFEASAPVLSIVLPLGISFYTLQRLSYVFDVYSGREQACRSPLTFALYAGYFPQLAAGPIARSSELLEQLARPRALAADWVARGAGAFLLGYLLKGWAADGIGLSVVNPVFADPDKWSVTAHWLALGGYAMQVFGDFAGYSLMAIGCSRLFGIELPVNFNHPFLSRSLPEFWRRWHITLNRWLFDYIYSPLTTSRGWFRGRLDVALLITFLASGLWHGAALTFVFWGLIHGVGMIVQRRWDEAYRSWCRKDKRFVAWRKTIAYSLAAWALTQLVFVLSLVPFRAGDATSAGAFALGLFSARGGQDLDIWFVKAANLWLAVALIVLHHVSGTKWGEAAWRRFIELPAPVRGAAYGLCIVYAMIFTPLGGGAFIYQQF